MVENEQLFNQKLIEIGGGDITEGISIRGKNKEKILDFINANSNYEYKIDEKNSLIKNSTSNHPVSDSLSQYYSNYVELRISYYLMDLEEVDLELNNLQDKIKDKMTGVFENAVLLPFLGTLPTSASINACCKAFAEYIIENYPVI